MRPYKLYPSRLLYPWGFSRQEYWNRLPCPPPGDLPDPEIEPLGPVTPALQADSLTLSQWGSPSSPDTQDLILYNVPIPLQKDCIHSGIWASLVAQTVNNPPAMQDTLGWEDPLEEGMATHSSILAWRIPMDRGAWCATVHGVAKSQT